MISQQIEFKAKINEPSNFQQMEFLDVIGCTYYTKMNQIPEQMQMIKSKEFLMRIGTLTKNRFDMGLIADFLQFVFVGRDPDKVQFLTEQTLNDENFFLMFFFYKKVLKNDHSLGMLNAIKDQLNVFLHSQFCLNYYVFSYLVQFLAEVSSISSHLIQSLQEMQVFDLLTEKLNKTGKFSSLMKEFYLKNLKCEEVE